MRKVLLVLFLTGFSLSAQSMVEAAGAAAGGSVGGVAGKKVSEGVSTIFGKLDTAAGKSAGAARDSHNNSAAPLLEVGPGSPKSDGSAVPPPPPVHHASARHAAAPPPAPAPVPEPVAAPIPVPPPPPPPEMTADDLRKVTVGMTRENLLKLGEPSSRITMFEEDHLSETFHYDTKDSTLGTVHLTDGAVSSIQVH